MQTDKGIDGLAQLGAQPSASHRCRFKVGDRVAHRHYSGARVVADVRYREHLPGDGAASTWVVTVPGLSDCQFNFRSA